MGQNKKVDGGGWVRLCLRNILGLVKFLSWVLFRRRCSQTGFKTKHGKRQRHDDRLALPASRSARWVRGQGSRLDRSIALCLIFWPKIAKFFYKRSPPEIFRGQSLSSALSRLRWEKQEFENKNKNKKTKRCFCSCSTRHLGPPACRPESG